MEKKRKIKATKKVRSVQHKKKAEDRQMPAFSLSLHHLKPPKGAHRGKRILGRGPSSGHGKTSTRGSKGQTSRSGRATYPGFEGGQMPLIRKIAKRGFTSRKHKFYQIINLNQLKGIKEEVLNPEILKKKGLIKDASGLVKILGEGEIKKAHAFCVHAVSDGAAEKIRNAGGKVEIINV